MKKAMTHFPSIGLDDYDEEDEEMSTWIHMGSGVLLKHVKNMISLPSSHPPSYVHALYYEIKSFLEKETLGKLFHWSSFSV